MRHSRSTTLKEQKREKAMMSFREDLHLCVLFQTLLVEVYHA